MKRASAMILLLLAATAASPPPRHVLPPLAHGERATFLLGAPLAATAESRADSAAAGRALDEVIAAMRDVAGMLDLSDSSSELSRLNRESTTRRFKCSPGLRAALDAAFAAADETDGAYDPTLGPVARLWDAGAPPAGAALAAARAGVGWRAVVREAGTGVVRLRRPGAALDLDGIARGLALDRAEAELRARGLTRALLSFGTEAIALSSRTPWKVAVTAPGDSEHVAFQIGLSNAAMATASAPGPGRDRGGRLDLALDPHTAQPVRGEASVTVVARSAARADALAAALLVMGRDDTAAFALAHPEIGVLWLEPGPERPSAWGWNLPTLIVEPGFDVDWKRGP